MILCQKNFKRIRRFNTLYKNSGDSIENKLRIKRSWKHHYLKNFFNVPMIAGRLISKYVVSTSFSSSHSFHEMHFPLPGSFDDYLHLLQRRKFFLNI